MFDRQHIVDSQKLASSLLRRVEQEDPRTALIAAATMLMAAAKACRIRRRHLDPLLTTLEQQFDGSVTSAAQAALDSLVIR